MPRFDCDDLKLCIRWLLIAVVLENMALLTIFDSGRLLFTPDSSIKLLLYSAIGYCCDVRLCDIRLIGPVEWGMFLRFALAFEMADWRFCMSPTALGFVRIITSGGIWFVLEALIYCRIKLSSSISVPTIWLRWKNPPMLRGTGAFCSGENLCCGSCFEYLLVRCEVVFETPASFWIIAAFILPGIAEPTRCSGGF